MALRFSQPEGLFLLKVTTYETKTGVLLIAPCVSIVVASTENNRGDSKNVFKSLPNLDGSKDDSP